MIDPLQSKSLDRYEIRIGAPFYREQKIERYDVKDRNLIFFKGPG